MTGKKKNKKNKTKTKTKTKIIETETDKVEHVEIQTRSYIQKEDDEDWTLIMKDEL